MFYERMKTVVCNDPSEISMLQRLVAGSTAGAAAQAIIYPLEITKTRFALGEFNGGVKAGTSIPSVISSILQREGVRGLYRGLLPSVVGIAPYAGVDLAVYTFLKDLYAQHRANQEPGISTLLLCGATSSTCGMLVSYPLQLVRTRLQAQGGQTTGGQVLYHGMVDCFRKTVRVDGILGLYRGILPNFMKTLPAVSLSYATYDTVKRYVMRYRDEV